MFIRQFPPLQRQLMATSTTEAFEPGFASVTPPTATWVTFTEGPDRATDQALAIVSQQGPTL